MSYDTHTPTAVEKPTVRMAGAVKDMTYQELDALAVMITDISRNGAGIREIATALLDWADEEINTNPVN